MILALFLGGISAIVTTQYIQTEQERRKAEADHNFELLKAQQAEERKYLDAQKAREFVIQKLQLTATKSETSKTAVQDSTSQKK